MEVNDGLDAVLEGHTPGRELIGGEARAHRHPADADGVVHRGEDLLGEAQAAVSGPSHASPRWLLCRERNWAGR